MSTWTLRCWALRTAKDASPAAVSVLTRRTCPSSGSSGSALASGLPLMRQTGATPFQIRCFHPTPARRLFESSDAVIAACLGVAGGAVLTRFLLTKSLVLPWRARSKLPPPATWWASADEKTRKDVSGIISAGFEMASKAPKKRRHQAYREATFQVPYEIARLNPDAPRFEVEEMAPLSSLRDLFQDMAELGVYTNAPFDIEQDARIFLYFPNGASQATAAFMAINAEYTPQHQRRAGGYMAGKDQFRLLLAVQNIWLCQNVRWARRHQDILHRIGPTQLPVIINFRGEAVGGVWDAERSRFPEMKQFEVLVDFMPKDT